VNQSFLYKIAYKSLEFWCITWGMSIYQDPLFARRFISAPWQYEPHHTETPSLLAVTVPVKGFQ
jgi:hypothetical protein